MTLIICNALFFYLRKESTWLKIHCTATPPPIFSMGAKALEQNLQLLVTAGVCCIYSQQSEHVMKVLPLKNTKIVTSQNRATKGEENEMR